MTKKLLLGLLSGLLLLLTSTGYTGESPGDRKAKFCLRAADILAEAYRSGYGSGQCLELRSRLKIDERLADVPEELRLYLLQYARTVCLEGRQDRMAGRPSLERIVYAGFLSGCLN